MAVKIIKGKVYDTSTAQLVGKDGGESLYLTKNGAWFLHDFYHDLDRVREYSPAQALNWLYENSKVDAVREYFPDRIEDA